MAKIQRMKRRPRLGLGSGRLALGLCCMLLGACASPVPVAIRDPARPDIPIAAVQQAPDAFLGREVRWGGRILAVDNGPKTTRVTVLAGRLAADGHPDLSADSPGRFIAEYQGFVDPTRFPVDRLLSIVGPIVAVEPQPIGAYRYPYPVVAALTSYLWPRPEPIALGYPYGQSPWGYGFGPFGFAPWCCDPFWYGPGFGYGFW